MHVRGTFTWKQRQSCVSSLFVWYSCVVMCAAQMMLLAWCGTCRQCAARASVMPLVCLLHVCRLLLLPLLLCACSVCGGCMALMDAGIPIKKPIAGVAMGLLLDEVRRHTGNTKQIQDLTNLLVRAARLAMLVRLFHCRPPPAAGRCRLWLGGAHQGPTCLSTALYSQ